MEEIVYLIFDATHQGIAAIRRKSAFQLSIYGRDAVHGKYAPHALRTEESRPRTLGRFFVVLHVDHKPHLRWKWTTGCGGHDIPGVDRDFGMDAILSSERCTYAVGSYLHVVKRVVLAIDACPLQVFQRRVCRKHRMRPGFFAILLCVVLEVRLPGIKLVPCALQLGILALCVYHVDKRVHFVTKHTALSIEPPARSAGSRLW